MDRTRFVVQIDMSKNGIQGRYGEVSFLLRFRFTSNSRFGSFGIGLKAHDMKLSHLNISILP